MLSLKDMFHSIVSSSPLFLQTGKSAHAICLSLMSMRIAARIVCFYDIKLYYICLRQLSSWLQIQCVMFVCCGHVVYVWPRIPSLW